MQFGIWTPARVDVAPLVARAEELGFEYAHLYDSHMLYADTFVCLALCAERTSRIKLGQGVTNPAGRIAPVMANCLATINRIAPGRAFLGIGTGYSSLKAMGEASATLGELAEYVRTVRALTRGEEAAYRSAAGSRPVRMIHCNGSLDDSFVNLRDPIPIHVAAFGPRTLAMAGELADGVIIGVKRPSAAYVDTIRRGLRAGAEKAARRVEDIPLLFMLSIYVMERGERFGNDHMKRMILGTEQSAIGVYSAGYSPNPGPYVRLPEGDIPPLYRELAAANRRLLAGRRGSTALDGEAWYVSAYEGHGWIGREELLPYVSEDLLRKRALIGTAEEIVRQVREWESLGVSAIGPMVHGGAASALEMTERFGEVIRVYGAGGD